MEILHEINLARFWKLFLSYKKHSSLYGLQLQPGP